MLRPIAFQKLRAEAQQFVDEVARLPTFSSRISGLAPTRPGGVTWGDLQRFNTLQFDPRHQGQISNRFGTSADANIRYLEALEALSADALLGVSWAPQALHNALADHESGGELEIVVPNEAAVSARCHLPTGLPAVEAGDVEAETLIDIIATCQRALDDGWFSSTSHVAQWSLKADEWLRWAQDYKVAPEKGAEIDDAFYEAAERHVPRGGRREVIRGGRDRTWQQALRVATRRLSRAGPALTGPERQAAHRARDLLVAAVRGGRGRSSASSKSGSRKPIAPVDPYEDAMLVANLRKVVRNVVSDGAGTGDLT